MEKVFLFVKDLLENVDDITANRMSIINGKIDFTEYEKIINDEAEVILSKNDEQIANCVVKIILAEIAYQRDDCYTALILVNSVLAFLQEDGYEEIWMVARYIQMCIMIVTGQVHAIYPLVEGMRKRIYSSNNKKLIKNYDALCAWCALYDDDWDTIDEWCKNKAPNEYEDVSLEDTFSLFIKARIYYMQEQHLAVITIMQSVRSILESNNRHMELCEMYMILAMSMQELNHLDEAYDNFEKCVEIAQERDFLRLLSDEGEPIYKLIRLYLKNSDKKVIDNVFFANLKKKSREMALMYPKYLKNHKIKFPKLTKRELEVLRLLVDGRSNTEMADFLGNSTNTVKYHIKNLYRKLGVNSREQAIEVAVQERIIR